MSVNQDEIHRLALSEDVKDRAEAARLFGNEFKSLPDKSTAWDDFEKLISSDVLDVRWHAAYSLGRIFPFLPEEYQSDAFSLVQQILVRDHYSERLADSLGRVYSSISEKYQSDVFSYIQIMMGDTNASIRCKAVYSLSRIFSSLPESYQSDVFSNLQKLAEDTNPSVRAELIKAFDYMYYHLSSKYKSLIFAYILKLVHDNDSSVRSKVAISLGFIFSAISSLPESYQSDAFSSLQKLAGDTNPLVRAEAVTSLGFIFSSLPESYQLDAFSCLQKSVNDNDSLVRSKVAISLRSIYSKLTESYQSDAFYNLHKLADDTNSLVRAEAVTSLGSIFSNLTEGYQSDAFSCLQKSVNDSDSSVRLKAASSLKHIFSSLPDGHAYKINSNADEILDNTPDYKTVSHVSSNDNQSHNFNQNEDVSVHRANVADQPSTVDFLGFEPYVQAIYEFLKNPATKPPLTMSIEGPWGIGKSSFMAQLKKKFDEDKALTVEFNPWRHDKEDALWAFFAIEFVNQLRDKLDAWENFVSYIDLSLRRINWGFGTYKSIFIYVIIPTLISVYLYFGIEQTLLPKIVSIVPFTVPLFGILKHVQDNVNPLASDLKKYYSAPNYKQYVAFIEHFHKDFQDIVDAYTVNRNKDEKIYVFIDDLDRCEIPKAAELLQALNLMIANDHRIIFIIGLDRMKVAAGLAVKYEPILPYLNSQSCAIQVNDELSRKSVKGLQFGYEFIEKFIQVPFSVPLPDKINIEKLIKEMSPKKVIEPHNLHSSISSNKKYRKAFKSQFINLISKPPEVLQAEVQEAIEATKFLLDERENKVPSIDLEAEKEIAKLKAEVTGDSERIRAIALMVSPALDNNPRRMKQFINLFRLRVFIATNTGLVGRGRDLTLEQLGKFVAITLKWPLLIANLANNPKLLGELHGIAIGDESENSKDTEHWKSEIKLLDLLEYGCDNESGEKYSLENLDVKTLLKVSPKTAAEE